MNNVKDAPMGTAFRSEQVDDVTTGPLSNRDEALSNSEEALGGFEEPPSSRWALPLALRAGAPAWIWLGMAIVVIGFILIAVGWTQVAGEMQVYRQMPYVVSAALVGLGTVMVGLTVLNITTRQGDGLERERQIAELITAIQELSETLRTRDRS